MAIDLLTPRTNARQAATPSCVVMTDARQAEALRPAWDDLQTRCARNELTQSPDWLLTWWKTFGAHGGRQLRLGLFYEHDRLIGLAPLLRRTHCYGGCLPFRRLELLASGEPEREGIYSNHIGILAEAGAESAVARRLIDALRANAFGTWDEIVLPMMAGDQPMPALLAEGFRSARLSTEACQTAAARFIPLPDTWEDYLAGLSSHGRRNVKRSLKAFDQWAGGTTKLECVADGADLDKAKQVLIQLHHGRWAGQSEAGVFRAPAYLQFHDRIMHILAQRGGLELCWLSVRGEPVAALYSLIWDNKVCAYQTGRRTDVPANLRPGGVLFAHAIRRAIEQGRREFDLLADDAFYKQQLTPHVRPLMRIRASRAPLLESTRRLIGACRRAVRRVLLRRPA